MLLIIKVSSKDSQTLNKFFKFFKKLKFLPTVVKQFSKPKGKKFVTILKSPHVNKTAQEQFEFRFYTKQLLLHSIKPLTILIVLKKIKDVSFPGIKLQVQSLLKFPVITNQKSLEILGPDNISLNRDSSMIFQQKCIQLFDCYGEVCLKNFTYLK